MRFVLLLITVYWSFEMPGQITYRYDSLSNTAQWLDSNWVSIEYIYLDGALKHDRKVNHYYKDGSKYQSYHEIGPRRVDTAWEWSRDGRLRRIEVYSDTGYLVVDLYDDGHIFQHGEYQMRKNKVELFVVRDSSAYLEYVFETSEYDWFDRSGIWYEFHPNGVVESEGCYLPGQYTVRIPLKDSAGCMTTTLSTSFEILPELTYLLCSTYLRDGKWIFYNEQGEKIREEFYEGGLLKSKTEY